MNAARTEGEAKSNSYTKEYYDYYAQGSYQSAKAILPIVFDLIKVNSLIDVGCGSGQWLKAARELGAKRVVGVDPNVEQSEDIFAIDFVCGQRMKPIFVKNGNAFDLAVCVEVAEHIEEGLADRLVSQLCDLAPAVLFSAAIPGQGGADHVNEQWLEYWTEKFSKNGYIAIDCIRTEKKIWESAEVEPWYAQNSVLFVQKDIARRRIKRKLWMRLNAKPNGDNIQSMIHPKIWERIAVVVTEGAIKRSQSAAPQTPLEPHIFLGSPNSGSNEALMPNTICKACSAKVLTSLGTQASSALTHNFNDLWCQALNARATHGITHFAMLHSDIRCLQDNWPDILIGILDREQCDLLSVIVPIKDGRGLTSTALNTDRWRPRRLTMEEVHALPSTFGNEDIMRDSRICKYAVGPILFNTGLWICRLDQPWAEKVTFDIDNRIRRAANGKFVAEFEPEDWKFARWCHEQGIRYKVTREIEVEHIGISAYSNVFPWGSQKVDEGNIVNLSEPTAAAQSVPCGNRTRRSIEVSQLIVGPATREHRAT